MTDQAASVLARLQKTLQNRGTPYRKDSFARVLALAEDEDMNVKWRHFLRTLGSTEPDFPGVMDALGAFLQPVWDAMIREQALPQTWRAAENRWM